MGKFPHRRSVVASALVCLLALAAAPADGATAPPVVDSFTASPATVAPGGTVLLAVEAHDPDCPDVCTTGCGLYIRADLLNWTATGGTVTATSNSGSVSPFTATAEWQAPDVEGTYSISVYLADSGGFMCGGAASIRPSISVNVSTATGEPPVIQSVTASPASMFPDETSQLACVAIDPDGDPVTYAWATDRGTVTPGAGGSATFTSPDVGVATVTCTASDGAGMSTSDTVSVAVVGAAAERSIHGSVVTPQRLAVNALGEVFVVDPGVGGVSVLDFFSGALLYRIPSPGVASVAVDWADRLVIGGADGARVLDRRGNLVLQLEAGRGEISDVAVDPVSRRYGVLHRTSGVVAVYDSIGSPTTAFGSTGDGADQLKSPRGLAATPSGGWAVADTGHGLIKVFDASGALLSAFGGLGGGVGEFIRLDHVAVDAAGVVYASDSYQSWVQAFNPDGSPREVIGTYGDGAGQFKTPMGIAPVGAFDSLLVASQNSSSLEVFRTNADPVVAPPPAIPDLAPGSLTFGSQAVGTVSAPQAVTLTNTGGMPLGVHQVEVQGDFVQSSQCGAFVDPGQSCAIQVSFRPTAAGPRFGSLSVGTTGDPAQQVVSLTGTAFVPTPQISLSPAALVFGDQEVGTVSQPQSVILSNVGVAPLRIFGIAASAEYAHSTDCPSTLLAGGSCTIQVWFAPTGPAGQVPGALTVVSDAVGSPHAVSLDGRAVAPNPLIFIADQAVDEPDIGSVEMTFTVTLSEATTETVTVDFATVADTALVGEDFLATSGTVTFLPGETAHTVTVQVIGDTLLEPDEETFLVELANAVNGEIGTAAGRGRVFDNEPCVGPNLLVNPSAEQRPDGPGLPGWTQVLGSSWQRRFAPPQPVHGDASFFSGTTETAELAQDVDVSPFAATIDAGRQWFAFDAYARTLYETPETARVVVEYRDWANAAVLDVFDTGDFMSPGAWLRLIDDRLAPPGTRWIRVRLISSAPGDTYFDALSLSTMRVLSVVVADVDQYEGDVGTASALFTVRLACPYSQEVTVEYLTADGTALAGEDYLSSGGAVSLPAGATDAGIPVDVIGDTVDENHEEFYLDLTRVWPSDAVLLDAEGSGVIFNDDFCPQGPGAWLADPAGWIVDWLEIGGVEYSVEELLQLLGYEGADASHLLARELIAAKLNLVTGSKPDVMNIAATVAQADAFLSEYPPGSWPTGAAKQEARHLTDELSAYNTQACP